MMPCGTLNNIESRNGLSPIRRQAIIWTNVDLLSIAIGPMQTNFSETQIKIQVLSFKNAPLKMSAKQRRFICSGLTVLIHR